MQMCLIVALYIHCPFCLILY